MLSSALAQLHGASANFVEEMLAGLDKQLGCEGLEGVSKLAAEKVDALFDEVPVSMAGEEKGEEEESAEESDEEEEGKEAKEDDTGVSAVSKKTVQQSYKHVARLVDSIAKKEGATRDALLRDSERCAPSRGWPRARQMRARSSRGSLGKSARRSELHAWAHFHTCPPARLPRRCGCARRAGCRSTVS